ncbi:MAG: hypothetical protein OXP70_16465 [Acidobacteriota bacterium]|nr:hypothetical protein [Acidobacteriota bacterium]
MSRTQGRRGFLALLCAAGIGGGCGGDEAGTMTTPPAPPPPVPAPPPAPPEPPPPSAEPSGQFRFEPSPPVPEDVYWGQQGRFELFRDADGKTEPIVVEAVSTNPAVLELQAAGSLWNWRALGPGAATIEIRYEGGLAITHEVETPLQTHDRHHLTLSAVNVNEDWTPFMETGHGGWAQRIPLKESPNLKYVEAVLWEGEGAVHVYEFDNSFDPLAGLNRDLSPEEYTDYRESFRVLAFPGMPAKPPNENTSPELSRYLRETFKKITSWLVSRYPDSEHHLDYHGHGAPGGRLLEYRLLYDDAARLLAHWTAELGRPLGVIEMGGPCNKSGFEDLTNFCRFAQYYVASDQPQGGFELDEWTFQKHQETHYELHYHRLFGESENLRDVLTARVDLNRIRYEYSRNNMVKNRWQQATYLHSCADFEPFARDFVKFVQQHGLPEQIRGDVLDYLENSETGAELIEAYRRVIIHGVDNRDFFAWHDNRNGMSMPHPDWWQEQYR